MDVLLQFFKEAKAIQLTKAIESKLEREEAKTKKKQTKTVLKRIDAARPHAHRSLMGAVPGAVVGGLVGGRKAKMVGAGLGAGAAMGDKYLEGLSKKREFRNVLKSYHEKDAALGVDVRLKGNAGIKRPPFRTEGSVKLPSKSLSQAGSSFQMGPTSPYRTPSIQQQSLARGNGVALP